MVLPLEATTWDENRLVREIASRLPKSWKWKVEQAPNLFWVVTVSNDESEEPVHVEAEAIAQLALLNMLGWLENRIHKPNPNSPWAPRQRPDPTDRPHDRLYKTYPIEDPPDLDPEEIASVYSRTRKP